MYEAFFHLDQRPFAAAPRVDRYFPAPTLENALHTLARCIDRAEGAGLLIGPAGSGKTLVCQLLAEQFRAALEIALLANGHLGTRRELLQAILFEIGLPYRGMEEGELRLSLIDHLSGRQEGRSGMLLLLDEAHTLGVRVLEEVRLITNLVRNGQPRVRLVLAGGPLLEEHLASPKLEAFSQRIASRCYLEALDRADTRQYIRAQLAAAGGDADRIFKPDALDAAYHATGGIPRLVNQVCDHALMLAFAGGRRQLNGGGIEEAWSDLQQLPSPSNESGGEAVKGRGADFIEFGGLEEEDDAPARDADLEPTVLLHQIDEQLSALDEDFQETGLRGSPDEAALGTGVDPFDEPFAEEEVVIDRYAALEGGGFGRHPQVHSREGRVLSALLAPYIQTAEAPRLALAAGPEETENSVQVYATSAREVAASMAQHLGAQAVDTASGICATAHAEERARPEKPREVRPAFDQALARVVPGAAAKPGRPPANEPARRPESPDEDQIVVEEDPRPEDHGRERQRAAAARPPEYRQLFASLRRG